MGVYCEVCKTIRFDELPHFPDDCYRSTLIASRNLALFRSDTGSVQTPLGDAYYDSFDALGDECGGCTICSQILYTAILSARETFNRLKDSVQFHEELVAHGSPDGPYFMCARPNPAVLEDGFVVLSATASPGFFYVVAAVIYALDDKLAENTSLVQRYNARVRSWYAKDNISQIQAWISDCKTQHDHGKSTFSKDFPGRLINVNPDITHPDIVKLVELEEDVSYEYVCLSHQWGHKPALRTTKATLKKRLDRIPLADLPPTFEDAVTITRALGYQHLWIDNLCIVQDNAEDTEKELIKMAGIYENADLTISATCAEGDSEGFLEPRILRRWSHVPNVKAFALELSVSVAVNPIEYFEMPREPLLSRGWTLQERCLPARMVHFGTDQVSWECPTLFKNEDCYQLPAPPFKFRSNIGPRSNEDRCEEWRELVEDYTRRNLTQPKDKLRAVGALACVYERQRLSGATDTSTSSYLAGVWKDDLPRELCWKSVWGYGNRAEPYRAPTWSWASVNAPVAFVQGLRTQFTRLVGSYVTREGPDVYGEVQAGCIELFGPLLYLRITPMDKYGGVEWSLIGDVVLSSVEESWDCEGEEQYFKTKERLPEMRMLGLYELVNSSEGASEESGAVVLVLTRPPDTIRKANNINFDDNSAWSRVALFTIWNNAELVKRLHEPDRYQTFRVY